MSTANLPQKKYKWICIATKSELENNLFLEPNQVKTVEAEGKKLCIARVGDEYFAVDDKCPHAGASLGQGWCTAKGFVVCPHHRYSFSLYTGRGAGLYVEPHKTEIKTDGNLYVGLEIKSSFWKNLVSFLERMS